MGGIVMQNRMESLSEKACALHYYGERMQVLYYPRQRSIKMFWTDEKARNQESPISDCKQNRKCMILVLLSWKQASNVGNLRRTCGQDVRVLFSCCYCFYQSSLSGRDGQVDIGEFIHAPTHYRSPDS